MTTTTPHEAHRATPPLQTVPAPGEPHTGMITIVPGFEVTLLEADDALQQYIIEMVPQFPFVPLINSSAHDMYKDRPLLLRTIMWACRPPQPHTTAAFETWFRQCIAHETVVLGDHRPEILQALLVFFAWYEFRCFAIRGHSFYCMAIYVLIDLLTRQCHSLGVTFTSSQILPRVQALFNWP